MTIIQMVTYPAGRLPSIYQEVEYIQSSGSQYIDTWTTFSNNTTIDLDIAFTSARSGWSGVIWNQNYNVNRSWSIWIGTSAMTYQQGSAYVDFSFSPTLNQKYKFTTTWSKIYRDGTNVGTISASIGTFTTPWNACIFKINPSSWWFPYNLSWRLYSCKIYESWTLKRDFVPCYRKSDSVIWVYDLVNSQFYTNAGSWTFTKWWNV